MLISISQGVCRGCIAIVFCGCDCRLCCYVFGVLFWGGGVVRGLWALFVVQWCLCFGVVFEVVSLGACVVVWWGVFGSGVFEEGVSSF